MDYPVEKSPKILPKETPLRERTNSLFMGTFIVSGTAKALVINTGTNTEFGKIFEKLRHKSPETDFETGIRRFGYFLMEITLMLVISILVINVYLGRPVLESFLFSLALADRTYTSTFTSNYQCELSPWCQANGQ